jgi:cell wall assembly regulator SMI1
MADMKRIWDRIHVWLAEHAPVVLASLRPGASEEAIRAAERAMKVSFPEEVKAAYRIHDGQDDNYHACDLLSGGRWNSLERMLRNWHMLKEMSAGLKPGREPKGTTRTDWWHPAWIPIVDSGDVDYRLLDLVPGPKGSVGQILYWWSGESSNSSRQRDIEAVSFERLLAEFANELEAGKWVYSEAFNGLTDIRELSLDDE